VTPLETTWIPKGKGKGKGTSKTVNDRLISCGRCEWSTKDSLRHNAISNMIRHLLVEHKISSDSHSTLSVLSLSNNKDILETFEKNLIRWIIAEDMAFSSIESPFFQQMIKDIPSISMPFTSRNTLASRITAEFKLDRQQLIKELSISSQTIALSLDGWTSNNDVSILAIIGHWLTEDFVYKESVLEFAEIEGVKSGENISGIVLELLHELDIEYKLLSITADNTSNNETLIDSIENGLQDRFSSLDSTHTPRFHSQASYIRCLAYILNLIVKKLLKTLKSGDRTSAELAIEQVLKRRYLNTTDSALARLRVLAIWISQTPERKSQ